jgi:hypothetical protein
MWVNSRLGQEAAGSWRSVAAAAFWGAGLGAGGEMEQGRAARGGRWFGRFAVSVYTACEPPRLGRPGSLRPIAACVLVRSEVLPQDSRNKSVHYRKSRTQCT